MMKLSPARDNRFPLRVIVPGYAAVRNVKWLSKIEISKSETEGAWQEGLNYKILPPSVTDAKNVDLKNIPSMTEVAVFVFSGITNMEMAGRPKLKPGKTIMAKTNGWAWSGGSDALSSFGKDLNSMSFDSWGGPASDAGAAQRYDKNGAAAPDDLAGAIDQSKRKRAVDPRTHG